MTVEYICRQCGQAGKKEIGRGSHPAFCSIECKNKFRKGLRKLRESLPGAKERIAAVTAVYYTDPAHRVKRAIRAAARWAIPENQAKRAVGDSVYAKEHRPMKRASYERRRALQYGNTPIVELLTEAQWRDILDQYHHRCAYCGKKSDKLTIDHLVPIARGGKHSANNVVPACRHCNSVKGAKTPEQWVGMRVCNE